MTCCGRNSRSAFQHYDIYKTALSDAEGLFYCCSFRAEINERYQRTLSKPFPLLALEACRHKAVQSILQFWGLKPSKHRKDRQTVTKFFLCIAESLKSTQTTTLLFDKLHKHLKWSLTFCLEFNKKEESKERGVISTKNYIKTGGFFLGGGREDTTD